MKNGEQNFFILLPFYYQCDNRKVNIHIHLILMLLLCLFWDEVNSEQKKTKCARRNFFNKNKNFHFVGKRNAKKRILLKMSFSDMDLKNLSRCYVKREIINIFVHLQANEPSTLLCCSRFSGGIWRKF